MAVLMFLHDDCHNKAFKVDHLLNHKSTEVHAQNMLNNIHVRGLL